MPCRIDKQRFDPDNLFRMNLNIAPAGAHSARFPRDRHRLPRMQDL
jgi:hypothetical protein